MIDINIAHYKITSKLGQGGMGAVYRATDTKLDREVAIKVLPESFAQDKERLARFEREAKALAALNHPNIAGIYGLEQSGNSQALILELVQGEDLSVRLKRGPLSVEEALDVSKQIAEALEAAHEKGIIHRDLKPGNVKLTADGKVKVLDFGLAKAVVTDSSATGPADSISPTITGDYTLPGTLLGTAGYMSPEQARGKPVDKRSDIWSFGCVLWECLTGQRLFAGETTTDSIGALLHKEIDWSQLPPNTPPTIQLLLRKCLTRDRKRRLRDIGDAVVDLEQAIADPSSSFIRLGGEALQETKAGTGVPHFGVAGIVVAVAIISVAAGWLLKPAPPLSSTASPTRRMEISPGVDSRLRSAIKFSPDGTRLAFIADSVGPAHSSQLYVRKLEQLEANPIPAAGSVDQFCWSSDGREIAFHDDRRNSIRTVPVDGGEARTWCDAESCLGIDWSDDVGIVFAKRTGGLLRVSGPGAKPIDLTTPSGRDLTHRWPHIVPGGHAVLFTAHNGLGLDKGDGDLRVVRLSDGKVTTVLRPGTDARCLSSGHLVFAKQGGLFGVSFDLQSLMTNGPTMSVVEQVGISFPGAGLFDVSRDGNLVYLPENGQEALFNLVWVDREGNRVTFGQTGSYDAFRISPEGKDFAYHNLDNQLYNIWIYDLQRGISAQVTRGPGGGMFPVWSPSGRSVAVTTWDGPFPQIVWVRLDVSGAPQLLMTNEITLFPIAWHPDSRHLLIYKESVESVADLRVLHLEGDEQSGWKVEKEEDLEPIPGHEDDGDFSRDGKWVAYDSRLNSGGKSQVWVRPFQRDGGRILVSLPDVNCSGVAWSRESDELYFGAESGGDLGGWQSRQVYVVKYSVDDAGKFNPQAPIPWKNGSSDGTFDVDSKGDRLLVRERVESEGRERRERVVLVENFVEQLRQQVPTGGK